MRHSSGSGGGDRRRKEQRDGLRRGQGIDTLCLLALWAGPDLDLGHHTTDPRGWDPKATLIADFCLYSIISCVGGRSSESKHLSCHYWLSLCGYFVHHTRIYKGLLLIPVQPEGHSQRQRQAEGGAGTSGMGPRPALVGQMTLDFSLHHDWPQFVSSAKSPSHSCSC